MTTEAKRFIGMERPNGIVEDIAADIGYTAMTTLMDWFGGTRLWVPATFTVDHAICNVIGEKPFAKLVQHYGGKTLDLPLDQRREISRRNRMVGALVLRGVGLAEIARISLLSERQVRLIRISLEETGMLPYIQGREAFQRYLKQMEVDGDDLDGAPA